MFSGDRVFWILCGLAVMVLAAVFAFQWSATARLRRRRRKSHGPIISKSKRPMVRFSVRRPKE